MKFVTVSHQGKELPGVLDTEASGVYFLKDIVGEDSPDSLLSFIREEEKTGNKKSQRENPGEKSGTQERIEEIRRYIRDPQKPSVPLEQCRILAPIPRPLRNIICLGMNYKDHVKELKGKDGKPREIPRVPVYFGKMATEIIGPGGNIELHKGLTDSVDYEVELAAIIGKGGRNIPLERAFDHIFGYTVMNDITARDLQSRHQQFIRGKSLDTFTAMGPAIVYADALKTPVKLDLSCSVNGELRQSSNTENFIFDLPYIISDLSKGTTLQPGDIIATGTPGGVGKGFIPPKYLKAGDLVECEIQGIGRLWNRVDDWE